MRAWLLLVLALTLPLQGVAGVVAPLAACPMQHGLPVAATAVVPATAAAADTAAVPPCHHATRIDDATSAAPAAPVDAPSGDCGSAGHCAGDAGACAGCNCSAAAALAAGGVPAVFAPLPVAQRTSHRAPSPRGLVPPDIWRPPALA